MNQVTLRLNPRPLKRALALAAALISAGALVAMSGAPPAHATGGHCGTVTVIVHADGSLGLEGTADNCDLYGT